MITHIDKLTQDGCAVEKKDKVCRSRGGESCAFDGAMIVLQPIADAAHIVHGPIACCGNSWEGRGSLSHIGMPEGEETSPLHRMGFTTDMNEIDIVYGSEEKVYNAIIRSCEAVKPKAIFVYATCVSGLIGEDIDSVCRKAEDVTGIRVIPVNAPGFVGPKNLGNRIAGEVLLDHVIGTGEPSITTEYDVNLIGEYNIAGDLWLVEPVLKKAGIRILSRMTGDSTFEEITWAHRAKLNVVVCSRALINVAREMEKKYGIPFIEVSFFGKTEMSKAIRSIKNGLNRLNGLNSFKGLSEEIESIIAREEEKLDERLKPFEHLRGKKAVLYTGGVKSWSFISALLDLGVEIVAVGTKKSTFEDEEKMKEILGENAPLVEDVTPKNLLKLLKEKDADILVAGGRNQYLAVKEGYPFVDVNQERHTAYAGYEGLVNLAEQINNSIRFYCGTSDPEPGISIMQPPDRRAFNRCGPQNSYVTGPGSQVAGPLLINPLKHSQSIGAAIAFQGVNRAIPVIHGAQGCTFLAKVLLTKHFREPVALAGTKLFSEDVVMGSDENISKVLKGLAENNTPDLIAVLTSSLSEVKGDDLAAVIKRFTIHGSRFTTVHVPTPDYEGGLETGYAKAVEAVIQSAVVPCTSPHAPCVKGQINVLAGSHLTPADFTALREMVESFGLRPVMLPDLAALDGSRSGISPLALGGTGISDIKSMGSSEFTISIGMSMELPAKLLKKSFDIEYRVLESIAGLRGSDQLIEILGFLSGREPQEKYRRQRLILIDGMRDAHFYCSGKRAYIALDPDHALQTSKWLDEMGAVIKTVVIPHPFNSGERIPSERVMVGDLFSIKGDFDLLISNSHAEETAKRLGVPLYQTGFPVHKILGNTSKITIGYQGSLNIIHETANLLSGHGT